MSILDEVNRLFQEKCGLKKIISTCLNGEIQVLRSVYWKVCLGLLSLPIDEKYSTYQEIFIAWKEDTKCYRSEFEDRQKKLYSFNNKILSEKPKKIVKFGDSDDEDNKDANTDNPLSNVPTSQYAKEYERRKLEILIDNDLNRLYHENEFFEREYVINCVRSVLLMYSEEEKNLGYRQGMHELVCFIVWVLHEDIEAIEKAIERKELSEELINSLKELSDDSFLLPDTYCIFRRLMDTNYMNLSLWYVTNGDNGSSLVESRKSEISNISNYLQTTLLQRSDPLLYEYINHNLNIHAASYGIKWLRLLFLREFSLSQCAKIWDSFFAEYAFFSIMNKGKNIKYNINKSIIPHFAVSMLEYVRLELLEMDECFALRRLMRYPPVEDVRMLIIRSIKRKHDKGEMADLLNVVKTEEVQQFERRNSSILNSVIPKAKTIVHLPPPPINGSNPEVEKIVCKCISLGGELQQVVTFFELLPLNDGYLFFDDNFYSAIKKINKVKEALYDIKDEKRT